MNGMEKEECVPLPPGAKPLTPDEISHLLPVVTGWELDADGGAIHRTFHFRDFYETIAFANAIAWIANRQNHHPDLELHYNRCTVHYATHSAHGLTRNDFICAARIDALFH